MEQEEEEQEEAQGQGAAQEEGQEEEEQVQEEEGYGGEGAVEVETPSSEDEEPGYQPRAGDSAHLEEELGERAQESEEDQAVNYYDGRSLLTAGQKMGSRDFRVENAKNRRHVQVKGVLDAVQGVLDEVDDEDEAEATVGETSGANEVDGSGRESPTAAEESTAAGAQADDDAGGLDDDKDELFVSLLQSPDTPSGAGKVPGEATGGFVDLKTVFGSEKVNVQGVTTTDDATAPPSVVKGEKPGKTSGQTSIEGESTSLAGSDGAENAGQTAGSEGTEQAAQTGQGKGTPQSVSVPTAAAAGTEIPKGAPAKKKETKPQTSSENGTVPNSTKTGNEPSPATEAKPVTAVKMPPISRPKPLDDSEVKGNIEEKIEKGGIDQPDEDEDEDEDADEDGCDDADMEFAEFGLKIAYAIVKSEDTRDKIEGLLEGHSRKIAKMYKQVYLEQTPEKTPEQTSGQTTLLQMGEEEEEEEDDDEEEGGGTTFADCGDLKHIPHTLKQKCPKMMSSLLASGGAEEECKKSYEYNDVTKRYHQCVVDDDNKNTSSYNCKPTANPCKDPCEGKQKIADKQIKPYATMDDVIDECLEYKVNLQDGDKVVSHADLETVCPTLTGLGSGLEKANMYRCRYTPESDSCSYAEAPRCYTDKDGKPLYEEPPEEKEKLPSDETETTDSGGPDLDVPAVKACYGEDAFSPKAALEACEYEQVKGTCQQQEDGTMKCVKEEKPAEVEAEDAEPQEIAKVKGYDELKPPDPDPVDSGWVIPNLVDKVFQIKTLATEKHMVLDVGNGKSGNTLYQREMGKKGKQHWYVEGGSGDTDGMVRLRLGDANGLVLEAENDEQAASIFLRDAKDSNMAQWWKLMLYPAGADPNELKFILQSQQGKKQNLDVRDGAKNDQDVILYYHDGEPAQQFTFSTVSSNEGGGDSAKVSKDDAKKEGSDSAEGSKDDAKKEGSDSAEGSKDDATDEDALGQTEGDAESKDEEKLWKQVQEQYLDALGFYELPGVKEAGLTRPILQAMFNMFELDGYQQDLDEPRPFNSISTCEWTLAMRYLANPEVSTEHLDLIPTSTYPYKHDITKLFRLGAHMGMHDVSAPDNSFYCHLRPKPDDGKLCGAYKDEAHTPISYPQFRALMQTVELANSMLVSDRAAGVMINYRERRMGMVKNLKEGLLGSVDRRYDLPEKGCMSAPTWRAKNEESTSGGTCPEELLAKRLKELLELEANDEEQMKKYGAVSALEFQTQGGRGKLLLDIHRMFEPLSRGDPARAYTKGTAPTSEKVASELFAAIHATGEKEVEKLREGMFAACKKKLPKVPPHPNNRQSHLITWMDLATFMMQAGPTESCDTAMENAMSIWNEWKTGWNPNKETAYMSKDDFIGMILEKPTFVRTLTQEAVLTYLRGKDGSDDSVDSYRYITMGQFYQLAQVAGEYASYLNQGHWEEYDIPESDDINKFPAPKTILEFDAFASQYDNYYADTVQTGLTKGSFLPLGDQYRMERARWCAVAVAQSSEHGKPAHAEHAKHGFIKWAMHHSHPELKCMSPKLTAGDVDWGDVEGKLCRPLISHMPGMLPALCDHPSVEDSPLVYFKSYLEVMGYTNDKKAAGCAWHALCHPYSDEEANTRMLGGAGDECAKKHAPVTLATATAEKVFECSEDTDDGSDGRVGASPTTDNGRPTENGETTN